jgi:two-component system, NarL family, invasion response regulator UvrY
MLKILIADDHPIVRQGLMRIIEDTQDMSVEDEVDNGNDAISKIQKKDYDLILLDITMPAKSGLEIIKEIKRLKPKLPILVLTMHPEKNYGLRALQAGANGYLTKERAPFELTEAIHKVAGGGKYISASLAEIIVSEQQRSSGGLLHETLSNREYSILLMIAEGKSSKKISEELCLSVKTFHGYRARIMRKMGLTNNSEITKYVLQNNLLD